MTEKLFTLTLKHNINVIYKFYQDKFADCDAGLLIKDVGSGHRWFLMNGKSIKNLQKHVTCKISKGSHVYMHCPYLNIAKCQ